MAMKRERMKLEAEQKQKAIEQLNKDRKQKLDELRRQCHIEVYGPEYYNPDFEEDEKDVEKNMRRVWALMTERGLMKPYTPVKHRG